MAGCRHARLGLRVPEPLRPSIAAPRRWNDVYGSDRGSSNWNVWQVRERRLCLVFSARREDFRLKSDFRASSDGSELFLCQPNCASAFEQAEEKRDLLSDEQMASMGEVCHGVVDGAGPGRRIEKTPILRPV